MLSRRLFIATLLALTPSLASAQSLGGFVGSWQINGQHYQRGSFSGEVRFQSTPNGQALSYTRTVKYDRGGATEQEQGLANLVSNELQLTGQGIAPNTNTRKAWLRQWGQNAVYRGSFEDNGDPLKGGWERLERRASDNNALTLMIDGAQGFPVFKQALKGAQESIHICIYKWDDDKTGRALAKIVAERARAGVKVRVITDSIGSRGNRKIRKTLEKAGCEVKVNNPIITEGIPNLFKDAAGSLWNGIKGLFGGSKKKSPKEKRTVLNRDHTKVIVIDGKLGFTGSMNWAEEHEFKYRDVHARIQGGLVHDLQRHFLSRWMVNKGRLPTDLTPYFAPLSPVGTSEARILRHVPGYKNDIKEMYLRQLRTARQFVYIENAYLLDSDIINGLKKAAQRGVSVRVIIPNDKDMAVKLVSTSFRWVQNDVVRSGVELYKLRGRMVHSKVATSDGTWSTIGSSNLDPVSTIRNVELNVELQDPNFAAELEQKVFTPDFLNSDRVQEKKLKWYQKLTSGTLHLFRRFL